MRGERWNMAHNFKWIRPAVRLRRAAAPMVLALAAATPAAAQDGLCADPRGYCGATLDPMCRGLIAAESTPDERDPACGAALQAYRVCLQTAADCPGLREPVTPPGPQETRPPCADRGCAETAQPIGHRRAAAPLATPSRL